MELAVVQQKIRHKTGNDQGNNVAVKGYLQGGWKLPKNSGEKNKSWKKHLQRFLFQGCSHGSKAYIRTTTDGQTCSKACKLGLGGCDRPRASLRIFPSNGKGMGERYIIQHQCQSFKSTLNILHGAGAGYSLCHRKTSIKHGCEEVMVDHCTKLTLRFYVVICTNVTATDKIPQMSEGKECK